MIQLTQNSIVKIPFSWQTKQPPLLTFDDLQFVTTEESLLACFMLFFLSKPRPVKTKKEIECTGFGK